MREIHFDEWLQEYEKNRRIKTKLPPKMIKRVMEERPLPGRAGLGPGEEDGL